MPDLGNYNPLRRHYFGNSKQRLNGRWLEGGWLEGRRLAVEFGSWLVAGV